MFRVGRPMPGDDDDDEDMREFRVKGPLKLLRHPLVRPQASSQPTRFPQLMVVRLQLLHLLIKAIFDPTRRLPTEEQRRLACKVLAIASCALPDGSVDGVSIVWWIDGGRSVGQL
jgi:hypothetical protein